MQFDPRLRALILQSTSVSIIGVLRTGRLHFIQDMLRKEWGIFQSVPAVYTSDPKLTQVRSAGQDEVVHLLILAVCSP